MTKEQWERVKELFEAASGLDPAEQEAFLDANCAHEEIRAELRSLLSEHARLGSFMERSMVPRGPLPSAEQSTVPATSKLALNNLSTRYEILLEVGSGGMGAVYQARDRETKEMVALKILKPEIAANERETERFRTEVRLAHQITHKNVCRIHEFNRADGTAYISMEFVEGDTLRQIISRLSSLTVRSTIQITRQICAGLREAHAKGIVHRDLKPENIMLDRDGQVKVMDFGIARSIEAGTTTTGFHAGTPGYMAPEQVEGRAADPRSDIYSLGLIVYEMLTGSAVFEGDTPMSVALKQVREQPTPPRKLDPGLPKGIENLILRCLEKDSANRFQSVEELDIALSRFQKPVDESPTQFRSETITRRRRWLPLSVWTALIFVITAVAMMFMGKWVATQATPSYQRITFRRGTITSARFYPDEKTIVYSAAWEGEPAELFQTRTESPESRPFDLRPYVAPQVLSVSPTGEMLVIDEDSTLAQVPFNGGAPRGLGKHVEWADWAPDATNYALVHDVEGNDRLEFPVGKPLYETTGEISDARFSPRGNLIAFLEHPLPGDGRGWVVVVDLKASKRTMSSEFLNAHGLAWSPQGQEVYFTAARTGHARALYALTLSGKERLVLKTPGTLLLRDISTDGRLLLEMANERGMIRGLFPGDPKERDLSWLDYSSAADLSRNGKELLFDEEGDGGGPRHTVYLRRTDGSPPIRLGDGIAGGLSLNGAQAISILDTPPRKLALLPTFAGESRDLPAGAIEKFISAEWFSDGNHILIYGSEPGHRWRCYVQNLTGGIPVPKTPEGTYSCTPSQDGKSILAEYPKGKFSLYQLDGAKAIPVPGLEHEDEIIGFDDDGHHLYLYRNSESKTKLYRIETTTGMRALWKEIGLPDPVVDTVYSILLTPDGKWYACSYLRAVSDLYVVRGLK